MGPELDVLRERGEALRLILGAQDAVTLARASITEGAPKLAVEVDEARARLLGLDLGAVAGQLDAALVGATGGTVVEGTEELPVRVRLGDALRADPAAIRDMGVVPPGGVAEGAFPGLPPSSIAEVALVPGEGVVTRRVGERANTVQGFLLRGVLPEGALAEARAAMDAAGFSLPPGYRLEVGGGSDACSSTLGNLMAPLGLIVTLSIAVVVMTFRSFRLAGVALVAAGLSAGLSMLALTLFDHPFGINAIIGLIGSIGVSVNAALVIVTALQEDEGAAAGDPDAMACVAMASSRHIVSTTITTGGGFLPLILAGGGFWPPFAMAVAGGMLLSTVVSFYLVPPAFRLVHVRAPRPEARADAVPLGAMAAGQAPRGRVRSHPSHGMGVGPRGSRPGSGLPRTHRRAPRGGGRGPVVSTGEADARDEVGGGRPPGPPAMRSRRPASRTAAEAPWSCERR